MWDMVNKYFPFYPHVLFYKLIHSHIYIYIERELKHEQMLFITLSRHVQKR